MAIHQQFNGYTFTKDMTTGYYKCTKSIPGFNRKRPSLHQYTWFYYHGEIPKGYHVHHKDENKDNNDILNLELITQHKHLSDHMTPERRRRAAEQCDAIRDSTKEWHASEEGIAWHREHAMQMWEGKTAIKYTCSCCGNEFESIKSYPEGNTFCSNACKSKWRRNSGLDNEERTCTVCGKTFITSKYSKTKTCGGTCAFKSR